MSRHSPGPWRTHATDDTLVLDAKGNQVASMMGDYNTWESRIMEANAKLTAAAPELLETLGEAPIMSKYHGHGFDYTRFFNDYEAWMAKRRLTIAKASGEQK